MTDREKLVRNLNEMLDDMPEGASIWHSRIVQQAIAELSSPEKAAESEPLPESVDEWLAPYVYGNTAIIGVYDLRAYINTLPAAHQAELAAKDAEIERLRDERNSMGRTFVKLENRIQRESVKQQALMAELAKAKAEGQREATKEIVAGLLKMGKGA